MLRKRQAPPPPRLKTSLGFFEKLCLSWLALRDVRKNRISKKEEVSEDGTKTIYVGIALSMFIINEIKKFFAKRDMRLINHVVENEYNGTIEKRSLGGWIKKILYDVAKIEKTEAQKIARLESQKRKAENILKIAKQGDDQTASPSLEDLVKSNEFEKLDKEADVADAEKNEENERHAALKALLNVIDEHMTPFYESHLKYHIMRIDYYWQKVCTKMPKYLHERPTYDMDELLRQVRVGGSLLGKEMDDKRKSIENEVGV